MTAAAFIQGNLGTGHKVKGGVGGLGKIGGGSLFLGTVEGVAGSSKVKCNHKGWAM
jgi:hypothetical protein